MADAVGGAGAPAGGAAAPASAPASNGGSGGAERGRIGDFGAWAHHEPAPSHQQEISLQDPSLVGRDGDDYSPFAGEDAQSQALAVDDSQQSEVMSDEEQARWRQEYESWQKADDLPEPFLQKFGTVTVNGQKVRIPVSEAFNGYMRQSDYSTKLREVYGLRDQVLQMQNGMQALLRDLEDGQSFLDAMVQLGKFQGFHKASIIYGTQLAAEQRMSPEQRQMVARERAQRAEMQRVQLENRRLAAQLAQQQQQQPSQTEQVVANQLAQMIPLAIQRVPGWVDSPLSRQMFELHFQNMLPSLEGRELSTDFVQGVVQAAVESVNAHMVANGQPVPQPGAARLPPVQRLSGPAPSATNGLGAGKRARIGDFSTMVQR